LQDAVKFLFGPSGWGKLPLEIELYTLSFLPLKDRLRISPTNQESNAPAHDDMFEYENTIARLSLLLKDIFTERGQKPEEVQISVQEMIACYFPNSEEFSYFMEKVPRTSSGQALL